MTHQAKKSLGQNFLKSEQALNTMCTASDLNIDDVVLEIGPGKGALTKKLLEKAGQVIAIEKDFELISILQEKFSNEIKNKKLILINDDILNINLHEVFLKFFSGPRTREDEGPDHSKNLEIPHFDFKIVANIPYNITGAILKKFLSTKIKPTSMTLLVQKEVAERIVARDKKESILSLSVKAYGEPTYIMKVHKRFFTPSPKVDSAIVLIKNISTEKFKSAKEEEIFFQIIKTGFLHKRKILKKNLAKFSLAESPDISNEMFRESLKDMGVELPNIINKIWNELNLDPKIRAENVPLSTWLSITNYFSTNL